MATAWLAHVVLAAVAYIPLLRTAPGLVEDDSKQYLYTDPARFMAQVVSLWNPDVSMGTVTHQYIGYLLPMGPYYALMEALGVPTWVAQRLWTGSLLFLAARRVLFLLRTLAPASRPGDGSLDTATVGGVGAMVAAFAYMLSPYVLQNEARQSALLLPWVGLPWMVGLTARALRTGGWRHPALFALVVALGGQYQRRGRDPGGRRAGPVGGVGARRRSGAVASRPVERTEDRGVERGGVAVVGVGARGRGRLRHGHPALHRVHPDRGAHQPGLGDAAGPRVLVLLRRRQAGPLPAHGGAVHDVSVVAGGQLRRPRRGVPRRVRHAVARARLFRRPGGGGHGPVGGRRTRCRARRRSGAW